MYQEEVMVPMGDWVKTRLKNLVIQIKLGMNRKLEVVLEKISQIG